MLSWSLQFPRKLFLADQTQGKLKKSPACFFIYIAKFQRANHLRDNWWMGFKTTLTPGTRVLPKQIYCAHIQGEKETGPRALLCFTSDGTVSCQYGQKDHGFGRNQLLNLIQKNNIRTISQAKNDSGIISNGDKNPSQAGSSAQFFVCLFFPEPQTED